MGPVEQTPRRFAPARIPFRAAGPTVRHRRVRSCGNDADAAEPDGLEPRTEALVRGLDVGSGRRPAVRQVVRGM